MKIDTASVHVPLMACFAIVMFLLLATAIVGYEAMNAAGQRLIDERMLNAVLVLVKIGRASCRERV